MKKGFGMFLVAAITVVLATFSVPAALAEDWQWCSGYRTITQVYPDTDFQFYLDGDTIDVNSSCANRFVIRSTDANYAAKVATLLSAFQNGNVVMVKFDDDDTSCGTDVQMFKVQLE